MNLRVGIAGYGLAGRYFHAPLLKGAGYEVAAILTSNAERAGHATIDFPGVKVVASISDLVKEDLDLIVVASANSVHAEHSLAVINAGIPVVIDKPMGRTHAETQLIVDGAEKAGVAVTTYFNRRWDSDALTVKRVLKEGLIGDIFRMDSRFERFRPEVTKPGWRDSSDPQVGGGLLLDLQPHLLSTALDWFGKAELMSSSVRSIRGGVDDDVTLVLKHASGVDSYLSASAIVGAPGPRLRILGTKGALVIDDLDPQEALLREGKFPEGGSWRENTRSKAYIHRGSAVEEIESEPGNYATFYSEVATAIINKSPMPVSTDDALAVASMIDQARKESFHG